MAGRMLVEGGSRDRWRRYNVKIDGELVGKIGRGGHLAVEVTPGRHHVQAPIDWTGSPHVDVNVADGTDVHLTVRPAGNPFQWYRAATKYGYFKLERD
jgi:hypothetical protein